MGGDIEAEEGRGRRCVWGWCSEGSGRETVLAPKDVAARRVLLENDFYHAAHEHLVVFAANRRGEHSKTDLTGLGWGGGG
jgi:hypothetical protein